MKTLLALLNALVIGMCFTMPTNLHPQSKSEFPLTGLNDQQERGQGVFLQRCSFCHNPDDPKLLRFPSGRLAHDLSGVLKGAGAQKEIEVRQTILKGNSRMPGFQYSLSPQEVDDLIAYLKML